MPKPTKWMLAFALTWSSQPAVAQSNLGELLDAGAKKLSSEEFKQEVVQRVLVGPLASGGPLEVMYASNGAIQGMGSLYGSGLLNQPISGDWTIDDSGRICTSMRIGMGMAAAGGPLPPRCQFWFKYADQYFFSDSDSDRHMRVFRRTPKQ